MELEVKFKCGRLEPFKKRARALGFKRVSEKRQTDTYFIINEPCKDGTRVYLRVREDKTNKSISLDYHRVLSDLETQELEVEVKDKKTIINILKSLGYTIKTVVNKKREIYQKNNIFLTFDTIKNLGNFIEIEINSQLTKENKKLIEKTITALGLHKNKRITKKGYPDLLKETQLPETS